MRRSGLALAVGALALVACTPSPAPSGSTQAPSPSASPSPTPYDPVARCASQVAYWVPVALRDDPDGGLDYQEMGLSATTYAAVRDVLAEAKRQPEPPDGPWIEARATEVCTQVLATASPRASGPGWP